MVFAAGFALGPAHRPRPDHRGPVRHALGRPGVHHGHHLARTPPRRWTHGHLAHRTHAGPHRRILPTREVFAAGSAFRPSPLPPRGRHRPHVGHVPAAPVDGRGEGGGPDARPTSSWPARVALAGVVRRLPAWPSCSRRCARSAPSRWSGGTRSSSSTKRPVVCCVSRPCGRAGTPRRVGRSRRTGHTPATTSSGGLFVHHVACRPTRADVAHGWPASTTATGIHRHGQGVGCISFGTTFGPGLDVRPCAQIRMSCRVSHTGVPRPTGRGPFNSGR